MRRCDLRALGTDHGLDLFPGSIFFDTGIDYDGCRAFGHLQKPQFQQVKFISGLFPDFQCFPLLFIEAEGSVDSFCHIDVSEIWLRTALAFSVNVFDEAFDCVRKIQSVGFSSLSNCNLMAAADGRDLTSGVIDSLNDSGHCFSTFCACRKRGWVWWAARFWFGDRVLPVYFGRQPKQGSHLGL